MDNLVKEEKKDKKSKGLLNINQKLGITLVIVSLIIIGYIILAGSSFLESIQKTKINMFTGGAKKYRRQKIKGGDVSMEALKTSIGGCGCSEGGKY